MPVGRAAVAAAQQGEPVVEPPVDVLDRHHPHLGGGQLDRQRQPVEPAHDAAHGVVVEGVRRGARRGRAARTGRAAASSASWPSGKTRSAAIASGARVVVTTRSRRQDGDQERDQVGDRLDDVLAVVEDEQGRRPVERLGDPGADVVALLGR